MACLCFPGSPAGCATFDLEQMRHAWSPCSGLCILGSHCPPACQACLAQDKCSLTGSSQKLSCRSLCLPSFHPLQGVDSPVCDCQTLGRRPLLIPAKPAFCWDEHHMQCLDTHDCLTTPPSSEPCRSCKNKIGTLAPLLTLPAITSGQEALLSVRESGMLLT